MNCTCKICEHNKCSTCKSHGCGVCQNCINQRNPLCVDCAKKIKKIEETGKSKNMFANGRNIMIVIIVIIIIYTFFIN